MSGSDLMKTTTVLKLLAISLILIFSIGPTTASKYDSLVSAKLSAYTSSSRYTLLEPQIAKPDLDLIPDLSLKPKSNRVFEKDLWQSIPTTGPYSSTCGFNNATRSFVNIIKEEYNSPFSKFYFGGGAGGGGGGGGGCCG
jgi:hypothetical protein